MQTIFDLLRDEHVTMRAFARQAEDLTDDTARTVLLADMERLLIPHAKGEEVALYPEMEKTEELRVNALEAVDEHLLIEKALETLRENLNGDADEWKAAAQVLREIVFHHLKEEEEKTFPEAEKLFDASLQEKLADAYLHAKHASENGLA